MADKFIPPTSGGQPQSWFGSHFGVADPHYQEARTRSAPQEAAQLYGLGQAMKRLSTGFKAPDIAEQRDVEYRNLRENIMPELAQHYGAGLGSRGAFQQRAAAAQAGVGERLAALQNQRQFEMDKLRQEQLPRIMELGLQPSFVGHITEGPFNPKAAPPSPVANQVMASDLVQRGLALPQNILQKTAETLAEPARTPEQVAAARAAPASAGRLQTAKIKAADLPATVLDKLRGAYKAVEKLSRPGAAGAPDREPGAKPTAAEQAAFEVKQLGTKLGLPNEVIAYLAPEHAPMLEYLGSRVRARGDLARIDSVDDIAKLYNFWLKNPAKREKIGDFFRKLVGKKPKERG